MNKKELLDEKIKIILSLNKDLSNSKEIFEKVKKENPELVNELLMKQVGNNSDESSNLKNKKV